MNTRLILTTVAVATAVQLAMVIAGHYVPFIKNNVFALGGWPTPSWPAEAGSPAWPGAPWSAGSAP